MKSIYVNKQALVNKEFQYRFCWYTIIQVLLIYNIGFFYLTSKRNGIEKKSLKIYNIIEELIQTIKKISGTQIDSIFEQSMIKRSA